MFHAKREIRILVQVDNVELYLDGKATRFITAPMAPHQRITEIADELAREYTSPTTGERPEIIDLRTRTRRSA